MKNNDLDVLDSAVAAIEKVFDEPDRSPSRSLRYDSRPYRPTRDAEETLRLIDKHITRIVRIDLGWAAVGPSGRACFGTTLPIAVCKAIIGAD